jgi:hypothetical protein
LRDTIYLARIGSRVTAIAGWVIFDLRSLSADTSQWRFKNKDTTRNGEIDTTAGSLDIVPSSSPSSSAYILSIFGNILDLWLYSKACSSRKYCF